MTDFGRGGSWRKLCFAVSIRSTRGLPFGERPARSASFGRTAGCWGKCCGSWPPPIQKVAGTIRRRCFPAPGAAGELHIPQYDLCRQYCGGTDGAPVHALAARFAGGSRHVDQFAGRRVFGHLTNGQWAELIGKKKTPALWCLFLALRTSAIDGVFNGCNWPRSTRIQSLHPGPDPPIPARTIRSRSLRARRGHRARSSECECECPRSG